MTVAYAHELVTPSPEVVALWEAVPAKHNRPLTLVGPCPSCGDECESPVQADVIVGGRPASLDTTISFTRTHLVVCNCASDHGAPTEVLGGCGRYWLATILGRPDGSCIVAVEENLRMLRSRIALDEAAKSQNDRVQQTAERWLGAVALVYGLFSLTGVATAKDALLGLSTGSKVLVALVLLGGVASAGAALVAGYTAAYGWLRAMPLKDDDDVERWYDLTLSLAPTAALRLRQAIFLAFTSLAFTVTVMLLVWFLPRSTAS